MLSAQLKIMAFKYESFGYENIELGQRNNLNCIKILNQIFMDHTKLNASIRKFYEIMKPITLFTYVCYFNLYIAFTYMCFLNYFKNGCEMSVIFTKLLLTTLVVSIDLFIMCYYYSYLENQINGVQFAMYSIDWTEKSIKLKKILLLAMSLNNANRLKMNITPRKSLNLEVFGSALRVSYSIISVLVKKTISK
ncbi:odorant receptor 46a-like [Daktulosphaira vitifoliae]|uniref:odorant receptor 46a-like n=1 Tax=Daktulosphaira vitifoliae TaxID=58002 RepID=UPI0021A98CD7|nr:odorant receptor 46a-like [Daktulosphaira vitifoliae]XP_050544533.1 odorant receptor 46a-like [Daktulosphaira vitifoliae]XP_050544534.1 odorant receptor 46a-like [Daktulosphaira vitifoliae]